MSTYDTLYQKTLEVKNLNHYIALSKEIDLLFNRLTLSEYSTLINNLINNL